MKYVFVCGPYRSSKICDIKENIEYARQWALSLASVGIFPVTPHLNTAFFDGVTGDDFFLRGYKKLIDFCDAVLVLDGWENSNGSRSEIEYAELKGKPFFYTDSFDELERWSNGLPIDLGDEEPISLFPEAA